MLSLFSPLLSSLSQYQLWLQDHLPGEEKDHGERIPTNPSHWQSHHASSRCLWCVYTHNCLQLPAFLRLLTLSLSFLSSPRSSFLLFVLLSALSFSTLYISPLYIYLSLSLSLSVCLSVSVSLCLFL